MEQTSDIHMDHEQHEKFQWIKRFAIPGYKLAHIAVLKVHEQDIQIYQLDQWQKKKVPYELEKQENNILQLEQWYEQHRHHSEQQ